jgi:hypothetical protein
MARAKSNGNGRPDKAVDALKQAQAALVQAQALLVQNQAALLARVAETDAQIAETNRINAERFARIEAILLEHSRILLALPDVIKDKIGIKVPRRDRRSGAPHAPHGNRTPGED